MTLPLPPGTSVRVMFAEGHAAPRCVAAVARLRAGSVRQGRDRVAAAVDGWDACAIDADVSVATRRRIGAVLAHRR